MHYSFLDILNVQQVNILQNYFRTSKSLESFTELLDQPIAWIISKLLDESLLYRHQI